MFDLFIYSLSLRWGWCLGLLNAFFYLILECEPLAEGQLLGVVVSIQDAAADVRVLLQIIK